MKKLLLIAALLTLSAPAAAQNPDPAKARAIVAQERARFSAPSMPAADIVVLLKAVASRLNAEGFPGGPFGLLVKSGGTSCNGYSCDIICSGDGTGQRQWDILGNADPADSPFAGSQSPGWDGPLSTIAVRPCEIQSVGSPSTPSSWDDATLRSRIAAALAAACSSDDPAYWFRTMRAASVGADWDYWAGRIKIGDGAGKGPCSPTPTPTPDPRVAQLQQQLDAANAEILELQSLVTNATVDAAAKDAELQAAIHDRDQARADLAVQLAKPAPSCEAKVPATLRALGIRIGCTVK